MTTNLPYDPAKQVPLEDLRATRDVILRMLDGGELLAAFEGPLLRQGLWVIEHAIDGAERRAEMSAKR
jgi:hypothetical protein